MIAISVEADGAAWAFVGGRVILVVRDVRDVAGEELFDRESVSTSKSVARFVIWIEGENDLGGMYDRHCEGSAGR